ncbi:MAG: dioxygenase [Thermoguttaceae bacterium]
MLRKLSQDGIGYSVVGLNDVRHVFAAAVPRNGGDLHAQAEDALRTIEAINHEEGTRGSIVHQAVFVADAEQIPVCRRIMRDFYGDNLPATTYIPQHPCQGKLLAIEALGVGQGKGEVEIDRISEQLVRVSHSNVTWVHCAQMTPEVGVTGCYNRSTSAFRRMRALLCSVGVRFDQVIRTWLYLGGIVADENQADCAVQRYKELNRARTDFFQGTPFLADKLPPGRPPGTVYPASTGIGSDDGDIMMSCIALATDRKDIRVTPLENPRQTPAFDYETLYSPKSPKFSRAMALSCGDYATIFISGTASITASATQHFDDVESQTHETLDNIAALISQENLCRHGMPGLGTTLDNLGLVRVYIKRQEDYEKTRAVCESRLGELPTIYAVADVCRPELLVEIEGIAFSRRDPHA